MDPRLQRAITVGTVLLGFAASFLGGILVGRSGGPSETAPASPPPAASPGPARVITSSPAPVLPPPGSTPLAAGPPIAASGQVLAIADQRVVAAPEGTACQALITPGRLGTCAIVSMAGGRAAWVVEQAPAAGGQAYTARILTYASAAGGWVERLSASDPDGSRWSDVNVLTVDLTGDGLPEVLAGFRLRGPASVLAYDVVMYPPGDVPRVAAHPEEASHGSVVVGGGGIEEYAAQFPNDEPACCPPFYLHRTIRYVDGFFRVVAGEEVPPAGVPPSQL